MTEVGQEESEATESTPLVRDATTRSPRNVPNSVVQLNDTVLTDTTH